MGLLDSLLYSQNGYGGQGGGLLDMLQNSLQQQNSYQPSAGFPQQQPGSGRSFDNATFDPAAYAPSQPANTIGGGNYQMPRIGNPDQFQPQQAMTPPNAQPAQGQMSPQAPQQAPQQPEPLPPAFGQQGGSNALTGLQSFLNGGGLISSIRGAMNGQRTDPAGMAQQNLGAQFQAVRDTLIQSGLSPREAQSKAMLAVMNPEAGKTILSEALTNKVEYKTEKDALGAEHGYWIDKINQTKTPAEGGAASQGAPSLLAQGVKDYNPNLSGEDYLNQFGPELKAAVNAYIKGDVMPTGNPRNQAIATKAKEIAQKYGADMGIPVSDAVYGQKRKYYTELGTNSPNSAGGQAKAFNQGISHLTGLADKLEKLDNSNGLGIPFVASAVNATRQGVSTEQSAISDEAKSLGQTVAGEVGKLFSGSAGGGVHERELTRDRFDTVKSKPQLAAALRATLETMDGGLRALEQRRDSVLGPNNGVELVSPETRQNIAKIQSAIDRLEGKSSASPGVDKSAIEAEMRKRGLLK